MKLNVELAAIENTGDGDGFCYVRVSEENGGRWLTILGNNNGDEDPYPLTLESDEEIDKFAEYLKYLLNETAL